jgi:N-terminal acetyltransferase B complex non-catalytic subunit
MQKTLEKGAVVKKRMDESGWIDRVLDNVVGGDDDATDIRDGVAATVEDAVRAVVDGDFLEGWAGDVVESWRDSVMGLACLKANFK